MSKAKDALEEVRKAVFDRKNEEIAKEAGVTIEKTLPLITYDVIQDPSTQSRKFLIVQIRYDLTTKEAKVISARPFSDHVVGLMKQNDKENMRIMYDKFKGSDK